MRKSIVTAVVIAVLLIVLGFVQAEAQKGFFKSIDRLPEETKIEDVEKFMLLTNCAPVHVVLSIKTNEQVQIDKKSIMNVLESRLRSAGIFFDKKDFGKEETKRVPVPLYVYVRSFRGRTLDISIVSISLLKMVQEIHNNLTGMANVWEEHRISPYSSEKDVSSVLSQLMDKFLTEYLRVNEAACKRRGVLPKG